MSTIKPGLQNSSLQFIRCAQVISLTMLAMLILGGTAAQADDIDDAIKAIQAVEANGTGHVAAVKAVKNLRAAGARALLPILKSLNSANPLAANWLRNAFESIAEQRETVLPVKEFEAFIEDRQNNPVGRRLAYERLLSKDPAAADRFIPNMLNDPGSEFRRDAVARILTSLEKSPPADDAEKIRLYRQALTGATDEDQVQQIVKGLGELKEKVDLQAHFGFLTEWMLIGPFDHANLAGYDVAYPPEKELNFKAAYDSKYLGEERSVKWIKFNSDDSYGQVDLRKALAHHKGAITYAATTFETTKATDCEVRLGTPNAWKVWVNGKLVFERDEYHRGKRMDQYRVPVHMNAGANTILLKVCQNEQKEDWAQDWVFQLRVCDQSGAAILAANRGVKAPATSSEPAK